MTEDWRVIVQLVGLVAFVIAAICAVVSHRHAHYWTLVGVTCWYALTQW